MLIEVNFLILTMPMIELAFKNEISEEAAASSASMVATPLPFQEDMSCTIAMIASILLIYFFQILLLYALLD